MGQQDPNDKYRPAVTTHSNQQPDSVCNTGSDYLSNQGYLLIAPERDTVVFGNTPFAFPFSALPEQYPPMKEYYDRIIANAIDEVDVIVVEEVSLLPALYGDIQAMIEFLKPLVDGAIMPQTLGAVTTFSGWMVTAFDYADKDSKYTMLYITELPHQAKLAFSGFRPTSHFTLSMQ